MGGLGGLSRTASCPTDTLQISQKEEDFVTKTLFKDPSSAYSESSQASALLHTDTLSGS